MPHIVADNLGAAQQLQHVHAVNDRLKQDGVLKISLDFPDDKSQYLENLVVSLHRYHGHGLPLTHSASRGWFWDVRPNRATFQTQDHQARSETMQDFTWHTDCSYEHSPPRFFALHVLQPDRRGGGTLSVLKVDRLSQLLSTAARDALHRPEYRISVPPEFIKDPEQRFIVGSLFGRTDGRDGAIMARFRDEIVTPLTSQAARALDEMKSLLGELETHPHSVLHLTPADLPRNSIILMDNHRWLHARNVINDPERHLRRVRWNAVPFPAAVEAG